jgi:ubiquinone/menaquinone biosynthesis C-methylase UbiE
LNPEEIDKMHRLEESHWWFQGKKRLVDTFLDLADVPEGDYLDIGCGTGMFLKAFAMRRNAYGLDASYQALSHCRQKANFKLVQGTGDHLPFSDSSFSLVTLLDIIEHVDDDENVLKEARRVCKPGGVALVTVPAFNYLWGSHDVVHGHKRRYIKSSLSMLAESAGFQVERITYTNFFIFFPVLLVRIISRLLPEKKASDMNETPLWLNRSMTKLYAFEAFCLRGTNFPWGVSLLMVLRKA